MSKSRGIVFESYSPRTSSGSAAPASSLPDMARYGNNGTFVNTPMWTNLPSGIWVLDFESEDSDAVTCGTGISLNINLYLTIEFWVKLESYSGGDTVVCKGQTAGFNNRNYCFLLSNFHYATGGSGYDFQTSPADWWSSHIGEWHHVCGTIDTVNDDRYYYIDGQVNNSDLVTAIPSMPTVTDALEIGRANDGAATYRYYIDGMLARIRIYNGVILSHTNTRIHYENERSLFGV